MSIRLLMPSNHLILSCPFSLKAGGEGHNRGWDGWMASPTQWTCVWANSGSWWWTGREAWHAGIHGVTKSQTWLSDWTELNTDGWSLALFPVSSPFLITFSWMCLENESPMTMLMPFLGQSPGRATTLPKIKNAYTPLTRLLSKNVLDPCTHLCSPLILVVHISAQSMQPLVILFAK